MRTSPEMSHCVANWCFNNYKHNGGATFHMFPFSRPHILKEWVNNMQQIQEENWWPKKRSVLCSDHFEEKCFDRTGRIVRLRPDAVPTKFKCTSYLKRALNNRKTPEVEVAAAAVEKTLFTDAGIPSIEAVTEAEVDLNAVIPEVLITENLSLRQEQFVTLDHCYGESPDTLRRKLSAEREANSRLRKKLRISLQANRRLRKKLHSLRDQLQITSCHDDLSEMAENEKCY